MARAVMTLTRNPLQAKPYVVELLPVLKVVLMDPVPGVRATSAKALGILTRGLGADGIPGFFDLFQFLADSARAGASSVERQGAFGGGVDRDVKETRRTDCAITTAGGAQGMIEVLCALGGFLLLLPAPVFACLT